MKIYDQPDGRRHSDAVVSTVASHLRDQTLNLLAPHFPPTVQRHGESRVTKFPIWGVCECAL